MAGCDFLFVHKVYKTTLQIAANMIGNIISKTIMNHFFLLENLMAGPAGIEPATLQLRRLLPSPLGEGPMWWARWESNP